VPGKTILKEALKLCNDVGCIYLVMNRNYDFSVYKNRLEISLKTQLISVSQEDILKFHRIAKKLIEKH
jgi:hypothetical protein